jgi:dihydrofolate reductase
MNELPKIVFSRTLDKVEWNNSRLVKGDAAEEVVKLKERPGKDLALFSNNLAVSLAQQGLIDEYRFFVNPVVLGAGTPVLQGIKDRARLRLLKTETLSSGVVVLSYEPA